MLGGTETKKLFAENFEQGWYEIAFPTQYVRLGLARKSYHLLEMLDEADIEQLL